MHFGMLTRSREGYAEFIAFRKETGSKLRHWMRARITAASLCLHVTTFNLQEHA